ncbi:MAG: hypothetical protein JWQ38_1357 [Flavipsychrobacter sp.]|nr:hypothetical protein [Flavipsychrobacter sp.]
MKKVHFIAAALLFICYSATAGIYRHDKTTRDCADLGAQPQFNCVGQLLHNNRQYASCVLIDSRHVLSAAHCFEEHTFREDTIKQGDQLIISNTPIGSHAGNPADFTIVLNDKKYSIKKITVHPDAYDTSAKKRCDLAIVELNEPITDVTPAILNKAFDELHADVSGAGFGARGAANAPANIMPADVKLAGENVIDSIGGPVYNGKPTLLLCDMDHPTDATCCNKMGSAIPRPLEYVVSGGDSGGGLFRMVDNNWQLVGICHGSPVFVAQLMKTGYYGQVMEWTRVSAFTSWIAANTK